jgi:hypothetical protein
MARFQNKRTRSIVDVDDTTAAHLDPREWGPVGKTTAAPDPNASTQAQQRKLSDLLKAANRVEKADKFAWIGNQLGREIGAWKDLTTTEADQLIAELDRGE